MEEEDYFFEIFKLSAEEPLVWLNFAKSLKQSYRIIADKYDNLSFDDRGDFIRGNLIWISLMLASYSLECLLKGIYVAKTPILDERNNLKKELETHNLILLIKKINGLLDENQKISLTCKEETLLEKLTQCAVWVGRYPIPKKFEKPQTVYSQEDRTLIEKLFNKYADLFKVVVNIE